MHIAQANSERNLDAAENNFNLYSEMWINKQPYVSVAQSKLFSSHLKPLATSYSYFPMYRKSSFAGCFFHKQYERVAADVDSAYRSVTYTSIRGEDWSGKVWMYQVYVNKNSYFTHFLRMSMVRGGEHSSLHVYEYKERLFIG